MPELENPAMEGVLVDARLAIIITLYSSLAITGLLGNLWVMFTVSSQLAGCGGGGRNRALKHTVQTSAYIYLILLSVVDLLSFVSVPLLVTDILMNKWIFSVSLCKLLFFCEGMNKTLSPLVLTALSIDRYIAVCRPTLLWMRQTKFALCTILLCFMASLVFVAPVTQNATLQIMHNNEGTGIEKCSLQSPGGGTFDLAHALACYFVPLFIICSVYASILRKLYRHTRLSSVGRKTTISLSRVVRCSVMVVAFYFICWTPYWTMRLIEFFGKDPGHFASMENDTISINTTISFNTSSYYFVNLNASEIASAKNATGDPDGIDVSQGSILFMYLLHSLPYAQSAFNWLFYAFLNRNLRNSGGRSSHTTRSAVPTSTLFENPLSSNAAPLWKNLQQVEGLAVPPAALLPPPNQRRSSSRSSTCLGAPEAGHLCTSLLDVGERRSVLIPRMEPSLVLSTPGKCVSFSDLPRNGRVRAHSATPSPSPRPYETDLTVPENGLPNGIHSSPSSPSPQSSAQPKGTQESNSVEWL